MILISVSTMALAGRLGDRFGWHARIGTGGVALTMPGLAIVGLAGSTGQLALGLGLIGVGMGALGPSLLALLARQVEPEHRGRASGALQLCGDIGGVLGPLVGTTLLGWGHAAPCLATSALLAFALPIGLWLVRLERGPKPEPPASPAPGAVG
jgi:MFS family permease